MEIAKTTGKGDPALSRENSPRAVPGQEGFAELVKAELKTLSTAPPPKGEKGNEVEYIVKPGDSLWKIVRKMNLSDPETVAKENGIADPNRIRPGQRLILHPRPSPEGIPRAGQEMVATWYGAEHHHKITASGERFNMYKHTLAHKTLPFGTRVRLTNPLNGKTAVGLVNDRGPFLKGRDLDVSYALAKELGFVRKGVTKLWVEIL